ncbi:MarR family transcriptional regulator [Luteolibacter yonseiensis]|uniref:MarR family transcriptional regulator n=1 Tax=Luteolibacter yonseiensis TaxID=1144680 RepID=A0A934R5H3_9BACT|nr:MarR family transcriptional regulator [Luteolibacter yonseiensis]MBK1817319.1 MarR family transcriptional regulator [Luteolibacter yonseiensis]
MSAGKQILTHEDYTRLADFRYALRCFLEFSEKAAAAEGLTPQQHQALLVIRASPGAQANIGRLAERLRIRHHSAVELAKRLEVAGLVVRETSPADRRSVILRLTEEGGNRLEYLTHVHRNELRQLSPEIMALFQSMEREGDA